MRIIILCSLAMLLVSCNRNIENKENIELNKISEYKIQVDSSTNFNFDPIQSFEKDNNIFIIGFDYVFQSINIFNLTKTGLVKKIKIHKINPDSIQKVDGFLFHNFDTIFLFHRYPSIIYMVDTTGNIHNKWEMTNYSLPGEFKTLKYLVEIDGINKQSFFNPKNKVLSFLLYYLDESIISAFSNPIIGDFSLIEGKINKIYGTHPFKLLDRMKERKFYGNYKIFPRFLKNDSITIISYLFDNEINIYNHNTSLVKEIKSKYIHRFTEFSMEYQGNIKENKYHNTEPAYENILYDKYNNRYLRIVKHRQKWKNNKSMLNSYSEASWSIIFSDSNFNTIAETFFDGGEYDFTSIFVLKNGLLVKMNDNNEGVLLFSLFDFSIKK